MRRRLPVLILVAGAVVAAVVLVARSGSSGAAAGTLALPPQDYASLELLPTLRPPDIVAPAERTLRNVRLLPLSLDAAASDSIFNAEGLYVHDDELYVLDFGHMRTKRFSLNGRLINSIGRKGEGPGEVTRLSKVTGHGDTLWVASSTRSLSSFTKNSMFIEKIPVPFFLNSPLWTSSGLYMAALGNGGDGLFARLNPNGDVLNTFGELVLRQQSNAISIANGELIPDPRGGGGVTFIPDAADYAFTFAPDGSLIHFAVTVGQRGFPAADRLSGGAQKAPTTSTPRYGGNVADGRLYINTLIREKRDASTDELIQKRVRLMDVYDASTIGYLYSFRLPADLRNAVVVGTRIYVLADEGGRFVAFEMSGL